MSTSSFIRCDTYVQVIQETARKNMLFRRALSYMVFSLGMGLKSDLQDMEPTVKKSSHERFIGVIHTISYRLLASSSWRKPLGVAMLDRGHCCRYSHRWLKVTVSPYSRLEMKLKFITLRLCVHLLHESCTDSQAFIIPNYCRLDGLAEIRAKVHFGSFSFLRIACGDEIRTGLT